MVGDRSMIKTKEKKRWWQKDLLHQCVVTMQCVSARRGLAQLQQKIAVRNHFAETSPRACAQKGVDTLQQWIKRTS